MVRSHFLTPITNKGTEQAEGPHPGRMNNPSTALLTGLLAKRTSHNGRHILDWLWGRSRLQYGLIGWISDPFPARYPICL